jgi:hypothetical protein
MVVHGFSDEIFAADEPIICGFTVLVLTPTLPSTKVLAVGKIELPSLPEPVPPGCVNADDFTELVLSTMSVDAILIVFFAPVRTDFSADRFSQQGPYQISGKLFSSRFKHSGWYAFSHPSQHNKSE